MPTKYPRQLDVFPRHIRGDDKYLYDIGVIPTINSLIDAVHALEDKLQVDNAPSGIDFMVARVVDTTAETIYAPHTQTLSETDQIIPSGTVIRVTGAKGPVDLASSPSIEDGADGQLIILVGGSGYPVTIRNHGHGTQSRVLLGDSDDHQLGPGNVLRLPYDGEIESWVELSGWNTG